MTCSSIIVVILALLGDNRGDTRGMAITATARRDRCYIRQDKLLYHTFIVNMRMYSDSDAALSKNKDHLKISIILKAKKCCSLHYTVVFIALHAGGSGVRLYDGPDIKLFILVGWGRSFLSVAWPTGVQLVFFFCSRLVGYSAPRNLHRRAAYSICESLFLIHQDVYHDLFVCS